MRSSASVRLTWPSRQFAHVGEFESSKSAMNIFAPELSALITIFRSTGPVISTRRSWSSSGTGATRHSPSRIACVSGRKSGSSPSRSRSARATLAASSSSRRRPEPALEAGQEVDRVGRQNGVRVHRGSLDPARHWSTLARMTRLSLVATALLVGIVVFVGGAGSASKSLRLAGRRRGKRARVPSRRVSLRDLRRSRAR